VRALLENRLAYQLCCLREEATCPAIPNRESLALVRERVARIAAMRSELKAAEGAP
jgi:hypothetical protein